MERVQLYNLLMMVGSTFQGAMENDADLGWLREEYTHGCDSDRTPRYMNTASWGKLNLACGDFVRGGPERSIVEVRYIERLNEFHARVDHEDDGVYTYSVCRPMDRPPYCEWEFMDDREPPIE